MPTRLYLRGLLSGGRPTSGDKSTVQPVDTAGAATATGSFNQEGSALRTEKGPAQVSITRSSDAVTDPRSNYMMRVCSEPLAAGTFGTGTWNVGIALAETNAAANSFLNLSVYVWRPSGSSVVGFIYDSGTDIGAEWSATEDGIVTTFSGTNVTAQAGDILVCEVWRHADQSMGTAYNQIIYYDGATDVVDATTADAASYIEAPGTIVFADAALPRYVAQGALASGTTTLVISKPTGTSSGDVVILATVYDTGVTTLSPPAGVFSILKTTKNSRTFETFWTRAGAETNYTFTPNTTATTLGGFGVTYGGLGTAGNPIDVTSATSATASNLSAPALTLSSTNERYVAFWWMNDTGTPVLLQMERPLESHVDKAITTVGYVVNGDALIAASGSTGPYTAFWDASVDIIVHAMALRVPAALGIPTNLIRRTPRYVARRRT